MLYRKLYYNSQEHKSVVVLLHAFPLNSKMWKPQIEKLIEEKIPFLAIDYPGFGKSTLWNKEPSMDDYANEVYNTIKQTGLQKVVVVGLSMGGYVALSLYRNHPEIFKGLVLASTRTNADSEEGKQRRFKLIEEIRNDPSMEGLIQMHLEKFYTDETRSNKPELINFAKALMKEAKPEGVIHALQAMANRWDSTDLLREMNFPLLVIAGEKDSLTSVENAQTMVDQLPKGELSIITSAHLSNLEKPNKFNKDLFHFLDRVIE